MFVFLGSHSLNPDHHGVPIPIHSCTVPHFIPPQSWLVNRLKHHEFHLLLRLQQPMKLKKPSVISVISEAIYISSWWHVPCPKNVSPPASGGQACPIFLWHFTTAFYQGKQPLLLHHHIEMMHPSPVACKFPFEISGPGPFDLEGSPKKT